MKKAGVDEVAKYFGMTKLYACEAIRDGAMPFRLFAWYYLKQGKQLGRYIIDGNRFELYKTGKLS